MSKRMVKDSKQKSFNSYAATKAQNEVYYQMASILKQLAEDQESVADGILTRILLSEKPDFFLEKSM